MPGGVGCRWMLRQFVTFTHRCDTLRQFLKTLPSTRFPDRRRIVLFREVHWLYWSGHAPANYPGRKLRSVRSATAAGCPGAMRAPRSTAPAARVRAIIDHPHDGCPPPPLGFPGPEHGKCGCAGAGLACSPFPGPPGPGWQFGHGGGGSNGVALTSPTPNVSADMPTPIAIAAALAMRFTYISSRPSDVHHAGYHYPGRPGGAENQVVAQFE